MKKVIIISVLALLALNLFAQDGAMTDLEVQEARDEAMEIAKEVQVEVKEALAELSEEIDFNLNFDSTNLDTKSAYMGVFHADLDLEKMQELGYDKYYGVLITGVADNTAADLFRLAKDDVIMKIGEYEVKNSKEFSKVLRLFRAGDAVILKIFRFNEVKEIDFVFGSRSAQIAIKDDKVIFLDNDKENLTINKKRKLSGGTGGGSWIPVWFHADLTDANNFLINNNLAGISELEIMDKSGILMQGGGGKGNVGKNWMIGGMGAGFTYEASNDLPGDGIRKVTYELGFGGVTLDKRIPLTKKIVLATGFMLGGAHQNITISQTDGSFDWNDDPNSPTNSSYIFEMGKTYIIFQPKVAGMYRILDWLAIRAEAGYMLSHSFDSGWKADFADEDYSVTGSPDSELEGFTFSIGPWFGF